MQRYLFFDTETTGLPREGANYKEVDAWPRLVSIGWILADETGNELEKGYLMVRPTGWIIPKEATKVHSISTARAVKEGYRIEHVVSEFAKAVAKADALVAHNIAFDFGVVASEMHRIGIARHLEGKKQICTMMGSMEFCGLTEYDWATGERYLRRPKLRVLYAKLFGKEYEGQHHAFADAEAVKKCFYPLRKYHGL